MNLTSKLAVRVRIVSIIHFVSILILGAIFTAVIFNIGSSIVRNTVLNTMDLPLLGIIMLAFAAVERQSAKIREEYARIKLMLDTTPLACRLWDRNGNILEFNEESLKLFKISREEFVDRFFELSPEYQPDGQKSREKAIVMLKKAFDEGRCVYEWMHQSLDGEPIPAEITLICVPYEGGLAVAGYTRDLREYKKMMHEIEQRDIDIRSGAEKLEAALKDAQKANNAKSEFLAKMSHEMRTPLNAIIGLTEIELRSELTEKTREDLEKVYSSGTVLLNLINEILDLSKIESGNFEIKQNNYSLANLLSDTINLNIVHKGAKPISFEFDISTDLPTQLYGDELRIKQILNNLLSNAFKYTEEGKVILRVTCERNKNDCLMEFTVSDTGRGMKKEDFEKLFSEYMRFEVWANQNTEGTGLGLAISQRLVDMMGGTIEAESEYGKGSVFTVKLTQNITDPTPIGEKTVENLKKIRMLESHQDKNITRAQIPNGKVLIVDDIFTNLAVAKGLLEPYGLTIDCASSGKQAIELIKEEKVKYDAVFMDHMMPVMNGIEATRIIREEIGTEYAKTVPIIALTANAIVGNEKMFLEKDFQDFISKPIDAGKLDEIIDKWVRKDNA